MPSSPNLKVDVRVIPLRDPNYRRPIGRVAVGLVGSAPLAQAWGVLPTSPDTMPASALQGLGGCVSAARRFYEFLSE